MRSGRTIVHATPLAQPPNPDTPPTSVRNVNNNSMAQLMPAVCAHGYDDYYRRSNNLRPHVFFSSPKKQHSAHRVRCRTTSTANVGDPPTRFACDADEHTTMSGLHCPRLRPRSQTRDRYPHATQVRDAARSPTYLLGSGYLEQCSSYAFRNGGWRVHTDQVPPQHATWCSRNALLFSSASSSSSIMAVYCLAL